MKIRASPIVYFILSIIMFILGEEEFDIVPRGLFLEGEFVVRKILLTTMLIGLICLMGVVSAGAITFYTPAGATEQGGNPVSAAADFTFGEGTIIVKLWNTQAGPLTVAQSLSGLGFVLSSAQTTGILESSSGLARTVVKGGTFSDGVSVATGWALRADLSFGTSGTGLKLDALGAIGPKHTIIGPPNDDTNLYDQANASIAGSKPHNPFLYGTEGAPVVFNLSVPGVTGDTQVTYIEWSFGTTPGNNVVVPLPPTVLLLGSGLLGMGLLGFWRKRQS